MNNITLFTILPIALGALVLLISILKFRSTIQKSKIHLLTEHNRVNGFYNILQLLIIFFIVSYLIVLYTLITNTLIASKLLTSIIFFFGSIFVFVCILLHSNMLSSIIVNYQRSTKIDESLKEQHTVLLTRNQQLAQTENVTIFALAYQAEMRDQETGQHLERTSQYVKIIAEELATLPAYKSYLTKIYIADLVKSAPLHDIGKVGIPDAILLKPGKLSEDEFEIIKKHCEFGANALRRAEEKLHFQSFLKIAIQLTLSHHEKWNGTGYPHGLTKDKIPISARIMALADVYDALRSKRCYKEPFSHEKACKIIASEKGEHFDPDVVDAFFTHEKEFLEISEALAD